MKFKDIQEGDNANVLPTPSGTVMVCDGPKQEMQEMKADIVAAGGRECPSCTLQSTEQKTEVLS